MDIVKTLVSGFVLIGLATTIGLHGSQVATAVKGTGTATSGVFNTVIKG